MAWPRFAVDGPGQGEAEYDLPIRPDWEVPGAADHRRSRRAARGRRQPDRSLGCQPGRVLRAADRHAASPGCGPSFLSRGPYQFGTNWDELPSLTRNAFRVRSFSSSDDEARSQGPRAVSRWAGRQHRGAAADRGGRKDRLIPPENAELLASEAGGPVELLMFEEGNHNCMNLTYRHRPKSADWMAAQLSLTLDEPGRPPASSTLWPAVADRLAWPRWSRAGRPRTTSSVRAARS